jgi:Protein of unknown function (DUF2970)
MSELKKASQRKMSFLATLKLVFWSFFGIRKKSDHESDIAKLNPLHIVIAGVLGAVFFITVLLMIVKAVVAQ